MGITLQEALGKEVPMTKCPPSCAEFLLRGDRVVVREHECHTDGGLGRVTREYELEGWYGTYVAGNLVITRSRRELEEIKRLEARRRNAIQRLKGMIRGDLFSIGSLK